MRSSLRLVALAALLGAGGCKDDPSFRLRWRLDGERLEEAFQCSNLGVLTLEATTFDELGFVVDRRQFPCFPQGFADPDRRVDGPTLHEGAYAVRLRGTNRALSPWIDEVTLEQERFAAQLEGKTYETDPTYVRCSALVEDPGCRPEDLVCDCKHVDVVTDETVDLGGFRLGRPPQCSDGIDNDRDGLVDGNDPACAGLFSLATLESRSVSASEFDLRISFLDRNPTVGCGELGISAIEVRLGDRVLAHTDACDSSLRFSTILDATDADGPAVEGLLPITLSVHLLGPDGEPVAEVVSVPLSVSEDLGGFFILQADFPAASFFEPIVARARFVVGFQGFEGAPTRVCQPIATDGNLVVDTVRIRWLDAHGRPLSPPLQLGDGTVLDGTQMACPPSVLVTPTLEWGDYLVEVEGLSAEGDVCFSNVDAPARAAPADTFGVVVPRVSASGSCRDCEADADCGSWTCDDGVCRP